MDGKDLLGKYFYFEGAPVRVYGLEERDGERYVNYEYEDGDVEFLTVAEFNEHTHPLSEEDVNACIMEVKERIETLAKFYKLNLVYLQTTGDEPV